MVENWLQLVYLKVVSYLLLKGLSETSVLIKEKDTIFKNYHYLTAAESVGHFLLVVHDNIIVLSKHFCKRFWQFFFVQYLIWMRYFLSNTDTP